MKSEKTLQYVKEQLSVALMRILKMRDEETYEHSLRVMNYSVEFAQYCNFSKREIETIKYAAMFHDIGKLRIPLEILKKPGRLTREEFEFVKEHPVIGSETLTGMECFKDELYIIRHHHERIDGKGYPDRLKGDEINKLCKLLTICDSYDAMTSRRAYKNELSLEESIKELKVNAGIQFDKELTDIFIEYLQINAGLKGEVYSSNRSLPKWAADTLMALITTNRITSPNAVKVNFQ